MSSAKLTLPSWVDEVDEAVDAAWEPLRGNPVLDRLFYTASTMGDFSLIWHGYNLIRLVSGGTGRHRFVRLAAGLAVESLIVNQGIKRLFRRTRPHEFGDRPHHLRQPSTSSFPSGHASAATMAAMLLNERRSKLRPLNVAVAGIVATSRIHVRIHHASDVVAGALAGAAIGAAWKRLWPLD